MSQEYHEEHINAWLENASNGMPSDKLAHLFGEKLKSFSNRASQTLNNTTLLAILKRVLYLSAEKHPVLSKLKVESTGIITDQFKDQFNNIDPKELTDAFRFLMHELLSMLGELTADILPTSFEEQLPISAVRNQSSERIEHLLEISKVIAGFETVDKTFSEIFMILGNTFYFQTILLMEKKNGECITSSWQNANTLEPQLKRAFSYSRKFYEYLVCPLSHHDVETYESITKYVLPRCSLKAKVPNKYITIPLTLSNLQPFGALQFECEIELSEEDLKFVNAVSNLLAISLDRFNKEQDVEERRQAETSERNKELIHAHDYARNLEKERDLREQFVSILTHDLRTPLTAAKMAAQLIGKRTEKMDKNHMLAGKVVASIDRMDQMIEDLLDANRLRAGESLAMTMSLCNMRNIVLETLRELSATFGDRFLLETQRENVDGYWNAEGIRRVLENLMNNAIKYGARDKIVTVSINQTQQDVQLIVHNYGNSIPIEDQPFLFEPFHRTITAKNGEKNGWGLGLTLVKGVAEAHGGNVKVQSNEKEGTRFIVTLPRDARPFQSTSGLMHFDENLSIQYLH